MQNIHFAAGSSGAIFALVEGVLLLLFGRRLFWLFVAIVGFLTVYYLFGPYLPASPPLLRIALAVLVGLGGALLAILAQRLAAALAGFFAGVYVMAGLLRVTPAHVSGGQAVWLLLAGVVAAVLALWLFDPALVVLSSLAGAGLLVDALRLVGQTRLLVWVVLLVVGILFQSRLLAHARRV